MTARIHAELAEEVGKIESLLSHSKGEIEKTAAHRMKPLHLRQRQFAAIACCRIASSSHIVFFPSSPAAAPAFVSSLEIFEIPVGHLTSLRLERYPSSAQLPAASPPNRFSFLTCFSLFANLDNLFAITYVVFPVLCDVSCFTQPPTPYDYSQPPTMACSQPCRVSILWYFCVPPLDYTLSRFLSSEVSVPFRFPSCF